MIFHQKIIMEGVIPGHTVISPHCHPHTHPIPHRNTLTLQRHTPSVGCGCRLVGHSATSYTSPSHKALPVAKARANIVLPVKVFLFCDYLDVRCKFYGVGFGWMDE